MKLKNEALTSGTLLGVTATLLGVVMLSVSGSSTVGPWLGAGVLAMGLLATATSILNRSGPTVPEFALSPPRRPSLEGSQDLPIDSENIMVNADLPTILCEFNSRFRSWHERNEPNENLWPAFDRWIRDTLNELVGARRVRCFRIEENGNHLISLTNQLDESTVLGVVAHGLIDHVVATGRSYRRGWAGNGELVDRLAEEWSSSSGMVPPAWALPIRENNKTSGLIVIGELDSGKLQDTMLLQAVGDLLELYWHFIAKTDALVIARRTDRTSGVLNRVDLTLEAEKVLHDSHNEGEPLVLLSLSVEGVRRLDDEGEWDLRDWLMQQVGLEMRRRLRSDDLIGRFSDDRFVAVLRRLDTSLGQLIARKLLESVTQRMNSEPVITAAVKLRCGLADAECGKDFEAVLGRSFEALQNARSSQQELTIAPHSRERKTLKPGENHG